MHHNELELDPHAVINKMRQLYPLHLAHVVSEVKCDILSNALSESQQERETENDEQES